MVAVLIMVMITVPVVIVAVPVVLIVPLTVVAVPIAMKFIPAMLSLFVQVASPVIRLMAIFAVFANGIIELPFGFFHPLLAFRTVPVPISVSVVGMCARHTNKETECTEGCNNRYSFSESCKVELRVQEFLSILSGHIL